MKIGLRLKTKSLKLEANQQSIIETLLKLYVGLLRMMASGNNCQSVLEIGKLLKTGTDVGLAAATLTKLSNYMQNIKNNKLK